MVDTARLCCLFSSDQHKTIFISLFPKVWSYVCGSRYHPFSLSFPLSSVSSTPPNNETRKTLARTCYHSAPITAVLLCSKSALNAERDPGFGPSSQSKIDLGWHAPGRVSSPSRSLFDPSRTLCSLHCCKHKKKKAIDCGTLYFIFVRECVKGH